MPDAILRVTKTVETGRIEFQIGTVPILATGVSDIQGQVGWNDFYQNPLQTGQLSTVAGTEIATVVTTKGVHGDKTAVNDMYRRSLVSN